MSTLQTVNIKNQSSPVVNAVLNADGTTTFGGVVTFAPAQTFPSVNALPLSGGTMTGSIVFAAGQTFPNVLPLSGGTMTGSIVFAATQPLGNLQFIQSGAGAVTRLAQSKMRDIVSVKDYGAVGDGTTDDTAAINAALSANNAVFFPAGTYLTSGNHNIKDKTLIGVSSAVSIIKLSGSNTNASIFVNGASIATPWGSGGGCTLQNLYLVGNWDGSTTNTETNISNIGALLKWWSGAYVRINDCDFFNSFGFGIFVYRLGYSFFNGCHVAQTGKNGIHLEAPSGGDAITSTSLNNCSINSCRGRGVNSTTGGNGLYIKNGFAVTVNECIVEDINDAIRIDGADNRSNAIIYTHLESYSDYAVFYAVSGLDLSLTNNVFAGPGTPIFQGTQFTNYTAINNFGLGDTYELPLVTSGPTQVTIDSVTPQTTITSVTVGAGTWQITGAWVGTVSSGLGQVSSDQAYAIHTAPSIPGFSSLFSSAVVSSDRVSAANAFSCLQSSLSLVSTVTSTTTFYLYGGPGSITGSLSAALTGYLKAVKVNGPYV